RIFATGRDCAIGPEGAGATSAFNRNRRGVATDYLTAF
ncbi:MAG: hypothetical protein RJB27_731, partial [Actinomycetota bacterium]